MCGACAGCGLRGADAMQAATLEFAQLRWATGEKVSENGEWERRPGWSSWRRPETGAEQSRGDLDEGGHEPGAGAKLSCG